MTKSKLLPLLPSPPDLPPLPAPGSAPGKEPLWLLSLFQHGGIKHSSRPGVPAPGPDGAPGEAAGVGSARSPARKPAPSAAALGGGRAAPPPLPLRPGSGAGRSLLAAPFAQAHPASSPPAGAPGRRSPAALTAPCRGVAAAAAVIAASAVRSQETAARGGGPGPGQSRPGGGGAGHPPG